MLHAFDLFLLGLTELGEPVVSLLLRTCNATRAEPCLCCNTRVHL